MRRILAFDLKGTGDLSPLARVAHRYRAGDDEDDIEYGIVAMRDTLRNLASAGKTVFVSSHILGEVRQLADIVGIIAQGRLVREGPIEELLTSRGRVRVRVKQDEVGAALARLEGGGFRAVQGSTSDDGWLSVAVEGDRASEINRSLAQAGIYASALTAETDLESVFLTLTGRRLRD